MDTSSKKSKLSPKLALELRKTNTIIGLVIAIVLSLTILSFIFGTNGLAIGISDELLKESTSTFATSLTNTVVYFISFCAMVSIFFNQLAKALEDKPDKSFGFYVESFLFYGVDFNLTFTGLGGWALIIILFIGELGGEQISWISLNIALYILIALLSSIGAEYGVKFLLKQWNYRAVTLLGAKKDPIDFTALQRASYKISGWTSLAVSWLAMFAGINFLGDHFNEILPQYAAPKWAIIISSILIPIIISSLEYILMAAINDFDKVAKANSQLSETGWMKVALGIIVTIDAGLIFVGMAGLRGMILLFSDGLNIQTKVSIATAVISKAFTAYLGAYSAEKSHIDASKVDEIIADGTPSNRPIATGRGAGTAQTARPIATGRGAGNAQKAPPTGTPWPKDPSSTVARVQLGCPPGMIYVSQGKMGQKIAVPIADFGNTVTRQPAVTTTRRPAPAQKVQGAFHPKPTYHPVGMAQQNNDDSQPPWR